MAFRQFHVLATVLSSAFALRRISKAGGDGDAPSRFDSILATADAMPWFKAKDYLMAVAEVLVVNCAQLASFAELGTFKEEKTWIVEEFAKNKTCTGTSSISDPAGVMALQDVWGPFGDSHFEAAQTLFASTVPGIHIEVVTSAKEIAELIRMSEENTRDPTAFEALTGRVEAAGWQSGLKLAHMEEEVGNSSQMFSGGQAAALLELLPFSDDKVELMTFIEQKLTGLTCAQVITILSKINFSNAKLSVLKKLKVNIVDVHNKPDIVSAFDFGDDRAEAREILKDVCASKNNPVFGVVRGNPIVIVVDKSGSMREGFTLEGKSWTRDSFCNKELANVVNGFSASTFFNIITYSRFARSVFTDVVKASEENKATAIAAVHRVPAGGGTNSQSALNLAYAMNTQPEQIYFLTDGRPNSGASSILSSIPRLDRGRKIKVNGIVFILPGGDAVARQFMSDLANQTGGFFKAVEENKNGTNANDSSR